MPNIACSGIPVKAPVEEWKALAGGDERLENALVRLHILFRDADTLGSLIDPKRRSRISDPTGSSVVRRRRLGRHRSHLHCALAEAKADDPATAVLGADAVGRRELRILLSARYTLVVTNVPYLARGSQSSRYETSLTRAGFVGSQDLATSSCASADLAPASGSWLRYATELAVPWLL